MIIKESSEYQANRLQIGELDISFQRTVRVPRAEGRINDLPAGLGTFPLYKVSEYRSGSPEHWKTEGRFIPMYPQEAMWISFGYPENPLALLVAAGMVNAVTGEKLEAKLTKEPQNYLTVPPQPWLDGFKRTKGESVYQFVAAELGKGETAEEQILHSTEYGGLQIGVYNSKIPLIDAIRPREYVTGGSYPKQLRSVNIFFASFGSSTREMGLGAGGAIKQKIYPDPYLDGRRVEEVWNDEPTDKAYIYIVHSNDFKQITGKEAPLTPINYKFYQQQGYLWFGLPDGSWGDVEGSEVFDNIKPVGGNPDPINDLPQPNPVHQDLW